MKLKRIMIAAPASGSGKTMLTCALLQLLKDKGYHPVSYKCGPDYIDPMFHEKIIGIPAKNLDTFFTGETETKKLFLRERTEEDFAVLEGVMGLFDGLGGVRKEGSSYHLAEVTQTPVILVVDAKGAGRSLVPLIAGFLSYDTAHLIKGVIFNKMTKSYYEIIKPLVETELHIAVLGFFPEHKELSVESRHLGLKMPHELQSLKKQIQTAAAEMQKTVSLEIIEHIAQMAEEVEQYGENSGEHGEVFSDCDISQEQPVVAVARDEVFCFYYQDNLRLLQDYGVKLKYFSPLHDRELPPGCSGILLGGGYPELAAKELSENKSMLSSIRKAIEEGMPSIAECGGFMYLHSKLVDKEGTQYDMAGAIPAVCRDTGKLVRFGYIEVEEKRGLFLSAGKRIRGHEFHYYDSTHNGSDCVATKPVTGKQYDCILADENHWWGFPHLYYPSNPEFAENFVKKVKMYALRGEK